MGNGEKLWIEKFQGTPALYYKRYVDDIFSVLSNSFEAKEFFNYINTTHSNIKFTVGIEVNKIVLFSEVLIDNSQYILKISTYHKYTYSGLLLNTLVLHLTFKNRSHKMSN